MIKRFFGYISQEVRGLHSAAYVLAGASLVSSLLALARDRLLAHIFGAGVTLDIYYAAFRIPDLIFVATGALVSVYILIPELTRRTDAQQRDYLDTILAGFSIFAVVVASVAAFCTPILNAHLFPELAFLHAHDLNMLTRIMLMQPILLGLSNILAGITQTRHRYALYALSPLLYNLGVIVGVGVLYQYVGLAGLAIGVVVGAVLHVGVQVPSVFADGFLRRMPRIYDVGVLGHTVLVSLPRALALSMSELAKLALIAFAGLLAPGSIAIFVFAYNLQAVPLSIIGASYSVAAFPTLAAALSRGEREHFLDHVALAARYVLFWAMPAIALIMVLRAYMVRVVLGTGAFDWTDTRLTAAVFALLALSLVAQGLTMLLIRAYYAAGRTFIPFVVSAATGITTVATAFLLLGMVRDAHLAALMRSLMRLDGIEHVEVLMLGIAYAFAAIVGLVVMVWHFERRFNGFVARISRTARESMFAALAAGIAAYVALVIAGPIDVGSTTGSVFLRGLMGGVAGLVVAFGAYLAIGSVELREVMASAFARLGRVPGLGRIVVASSSEEHPSQM